jgi:putative peptidoglycan lipid II flippase
MLSKKAIFIKTAQVATSTLLSRVLGIIREVLMVRFLGATALSDAFITAFKIPNSLRKIFAEGALSAALVPSLVTTLTKSGKQAVSRLVTIAFIFFEGTVLLICALTIMWADTVIVTIAPGFSQTQIQAAIPFLQIMMPFIFFVSSSAILAGALQSVGHFLIPSLGSVILNIIFIAVLSLCLTHGYSVEFLCMGILVSGFIQFMTHFITYGAYDFHLTRFSRQDIKDFGRVVTKFLGSLLGVSVMELALFVDTSFASYLSKGSLSLINYANRFMNIPLGVFAVAFSTIMLPHFSKLHNEHPEKFQFYIGEAAKLILWVTIPITLLMSFFAYDIFYTIFLSDKFVLAQVTQASSILIAFVVGLFFFSLNKILLNVYYVQHNTYIPGLIAVIVTILNMILNYVLMKLLQGVGIALATTISSGILQTILLIMGLRYYYKMHFEWRGYALFIGRYFLQLAFITPVYWALFYGLKLILNTSSYGSLFLHTGLFWLWAGPLSTLYFVSLFMTRKQFGIYGYFLGDE